MSEREALDAALEDDKRLDDPDFDDYVIELNSNNAAVIYQAATKYLAQLPEKCGNAWHLMRELDPESKPFLDECPTCHNRGVLYPPALVEVAGRAAAAASFARTMSEEQRTLIALAVLRACDEWVGHQELEAM
jgi:hypothetical protein